MGYPDFLCIGARKAGTTWLHTNLDKHPEIYLPPVKEMHYLDHSRTWLGQRLLGRAAYLRNARQHLFRTLADWPRAASMEDLQWALRYCLWPRSDKWYQSLFPPGGYRICGEVCPGYARLDDKVVASVAHRMPRVRIIYLMRDPIECAWSSAGAHFEKKLGTRGVFRAEPKHVEGYFAKKNSVSHLSYARNLANWERHYPADQIFTSFYDDLKSDPREVFRRVLSFLGLDDAEASIPADVDRKHGTKEGRRSVEIPARYHRFLADLYVDSLEELDARFANEHTGRWLAAAREVLTAQAD